MTGSRLEEHCNKKNVTEIVLRYLVFFQSFQRHVHFPVSLGSLEYQRQYRMDNQPPTNPNSKPAKRQTISHPHSSIHTCTITREEKHHHRTRFFFSCSAIIG